MQSIRSSLQDGWTILSWVSSHSFRHANVQSCLWLLGQRFSSLQFTVTSTNGFYSPPPPPPTPLDQKWFETGLRTLKIKIMPRNLNEIVPSWIRLQMRRQFTCNRRTQRRAIGLREKCDVNCGFLAQEPLVSAEADCCQNLYSSPLQTEEGGGVKKMLLQRSQFYYLRR